MTAYRKISSANERELLDLIAVGSESAFQELFFRWEPRLSGFIFRITKSKEVTSEIVQDVFLKIWTNRETLVNVSNFKAYLFVISRNQALNELKKILRELKRHHSLDDQHTNLWQEDNTQQDEQYLLMDEAIRKLPERQQQVFVLSRYERLTYHEIAEKLNIGKESVKTHLKLATASVTAYLKSRARQIILLMGAFSDFF